MRSISVITFFSLFAIVAGIVAITPAAFADHTEVTISPVPGSSSLGCETGDGCYSPKEATVDVGGSVIFSNTDTAAHTFTAGSAADGPSGAFDSSLVIAGSSYEWKPTTAGSFPFYCMVHPWMAGLIVVEEAGHDANTGDMAGGNMAGDTMQSGDATSTGMLSDGVKVSVWASAPTSGEAMKISTEFANSQHVNYDIKVTQNGNVVLDEMGAHDHQGTG